MLVSLVPAIMSICIVCMTACERKELSMGEHDQPIVGMKSCFDFTDMEGSVHHNFNKLPFALLLCCV